MLTGTLSILNPWILTGLVILPAVWWLLRITPPPERHMTFPPLRLLADMYPSTITPACTPLWILLLRVLILALVLAGLAGPVMDARLPAESRRPLLVVVDTGWAAAAGWQDRTRALNTVLDDAASLSRPVQVVATTLRPGESYPAASPRGSAADARAWLRRMAPAPHHPDYAAFAAWLNRPGTVPDAVETLWLSDGLEHPEQDEAAMLLQQRGPVTVLLAPPTRTAVLLRPPERTATGIELTARRPDDGQLPPRTLVARGLDRNGTVRVSQPLTLPAGTTEATITLDLEPDLIPLVTRLDITDPGGIPLGAGAVQLTDDRWQRLPAGVVTRGDNSLPLLSGSWYAERALAGSLSVYTGSVTTLLARRLSTVVIPGGTIPDSEVEPLSQWVDQGGVLIRFADTALAERGDTALLPVSLRTGGRFMGKGLSWQEPLPLAPFDSTSPLSGLTVPDGITVSTQLMAHPGPETESRTWARLRDGTPLITGLRSGAGWIVLIHTSANTDWTTLPLSGLFPALLDRLAGLGAGTAEAAARDAPLPPWQVLDGYGQPVTPGAGVKPLPAAAETPETRITVGPEHPPGWYGIPGNRQALSLATRTTAMDARTHWPDGIYVQTAGETAATRMTSGLGPLLLGMALALLVADSLIHALPAVRSCLLQGLRRTGAMLALMTLLPLASATRADAADNPDITDALDTRLAWVATGDVDIDILTESGLQRLTGALALRTSAELAKPRRINPHTDTLEFYPLIYWPVAPGAVGVPTQTRDRVARYLERGGLLVLDGRHPDNAAALRTVMASLDLPPLRRMPEDHVLTRSFYLLPNLPGRIANADVWIGEQAARGEGVSPVIASSADWAGAWASDRRGHPVLPMVPPGERGRELALRSGINMVMYALTGDYKADQVHLPAILERLTQ
ncbi:DUF4159 domain-containing protein [Haematospirillum jordaniae]|uniref:LytTR family transcriptional regulator n=1 Tax=Haematospirillum jordaniae TaxID=1549855 RepID=A0A143DDF8_9PROT|nr:DUF4159 domain-containing protein [Haematospirillum jordaniae]AMW34706.1 hypothetical protein AY555_05390 [Haematospirillum jordaniae]NKD44753.1 DUF4159 domain-containing protein [Haematospirillum jordaniae]NKD56942.1 DUF4159 domain-containing protein [Haematospirillum jordaniae]NKD58902.1 DUF4159 domain-containing protein [Haematospirillum jordaniae]NKD66867.1 DUF4159 domain-containing protein [Haematospirillum jordaniae]